VIPTQQPVLYFDLSSPYAYLAVMRAGAVLGTAPELEPVLAGAIFAWRGRGSWAESEPGRSEGQAEIERRARRYGLPPLRWPSGWPGNSLQAMRAAVWAKRQGRVDPFARAVYTHLFATGADVSDPATLGAAAREAGLDPDAMASAIASPELKEALKAATQAAWDAGVRGVPTLRIGTATFFGDDQLERAAAA
jgi:2-hydroxychromene-2-carboxylate isomerase